MIFVHTLAQSRRQYVRTGDLLCESCSVNSADSRVSVMNPVTGRAGTFVICGDCEAALFVKLDRRAKRQAVTGLVGK
jgi:hypothetical protein